MVDKINELKKAKQSYDKLSITVKKETNVKLNNFAKKHGVKKSRLIDKLLNDFIDNVEKDLEENKN